MPSAGRSTELNTGGERERTPAPSPPAPRATYWPLGPAAAGGEERERNPNTLALSAASLSLAVGPCRGQSASARSRTARSRKQSLIALVRRRRPEARARRAPSGLEPLEPYKNAHARWRCRCTKCDREVAPRYHSIRKGQGGCKHCSKKGPKDCECRRADLAFTA